MLTRSRPEGAQLIRLAGVLDGRPLSYASGLLAYVHVVTPTPLSPRGVGDGWFVDRFAGVIGQGTNDFDAARHALRTWAMFDQPWTAVMEPRPPIEVDSVVAYAAQVLGVWWSYGCRVTEVFDEASRFGFVYGTVDGHAERGEERFQVRLLANHDVEFSLLAMSRPGRWFSWIGIPIARRAQRRFRSGAADAMRRTVDRRRLTETTNN